MSCSCSCSCRRIKRRSSTRSCVCVLLCQKEKCEESICDISIQQLGWKPQRRIYIAHTLDFSVSARVDMGRLWMEFTNRMAGTRRARIRTAFVMVRVCAIPFGLRQRTLGSLLQIKEQCGIIMVQYRRQLLPHLKRFSKRKDNNHVSFDRRRRDVTRMFPVRIL